MGKYPYFPSVETTWKKKQKFDNLEISEKTVTPSNPSVNNRKLYFKNDGSLYQLDSTGTEVAVGGSSGGGNPKILLGNDTTIGNYTDPNNVNVSSGAVTSGVSSTADVYSGYGNSTGNNGNINSYSNFYTGTQNYWGSRVCYKWDYNSPITNVTQLKVGHGKAGNGGYSVYYVESNGSQTTIDSSTGGNGTYSSRIDTVNFSTPITLDYIEIKSISQTYGCSFYGSGVEVTGDFASVGAELTDGNTSTRWLSALEENPNAYFDMGSSTLTSQVSIYPHSDNTETEVLIQTSDDSITWNTKRTVLTSNLTNGQWNFIRFNPHNCRYIRVYGNSGLLKELALVEVNAKIQVTLLTEDIMLNHIHQDIDSTDTSLNLAGESV